MDGYVTLSDEQQARVNDALRRLQEISLEKDRADEDWNELCSRIGSEIAAKIGFSIGDKIARRVRGKMKMVTTHYRIMSFTIMRRESFFERREQFVVIASCLRINRFGRPLRAYYNTEAITLDEKVTTA